MAVPRVLRIFKVRDQGNLEFWVSNLVIVLSTVLGVFLAAQAGYRTALDFETARGEREGYFMRRALLDELNDNLKQADVFADNIINKDGWRFQSQKEIFALQNFVWETMKQQSVTFQLPSMILTGVRRYYDTADALAGGLAQGQGTAIELAKSWQKETNSVRETLVPALEHDIADLRGRLAHRGIAVE